MDLNEIDDLDDDLMNEESPQPDDNQDSYEEHPYDDDYQEDDTVTYEDEEEEDVISAFLRSKGINPNSIKFTGDDGEQEEKKFSDLTAEEQLQILQYNDLDDNYGLTAEETQLINSLRKNNLSVQDYNNYIAKQAIDNYLTTPSADNEGQDKAHNLGNGHDPNERYKHIVNAVNTKYY